MTNGAQSPQIQFLHIWVDQENRKGDYISFGRRIDPIDFSAVANRRRHC